MQIQRALALLAAAPLFLSACSSSSSSTSSLTEPSSTTSTTEARVVVTPTTTIPVSTTTTQSVEVLLPGNDVDDPTEAIVAIYSYLAYLHTIPDLGKNYLDLIYLESCDCYAEVIGFLNDYLTNGWVQDDQGIVVVDAIVSQQFESGDVLLQVTDTWSPQYVRDQDGRRIRLEDDEWNNEVSLIGLERGTDQRWRVAVIGVVGEATP